MRFHFGLTDLAYPDDIALLGDSFVAVQEAPWVLHALEDRYLSASPRGYINCWSGTEMGLT